MPTGQSDMVVVDDDGDDDGDDDDDDGSKQRVGDHMIPPPTAVGGPTASNRHRTLEEKISTQNTNTKYRIQNSKH